MSIFAFSITNVPIAPSTLFTHTYKGFYCVSYLRTRSYSVLHIDSNSIAMNGAYPDNYPMDSYGSFLNTLVDTYLEITEDVALLSD